jgi:hypothetical protein
MRDYSKRFKIFRLYVNKCILLGKILKENAIYISAVYAVQLNCTRNENTVQRLS